MARIDPGSSSSVTIIVGERPVAITFGADAAWVANAGEGTVSRIDPATNDVVEAIAIGNRTAGIAFAYGTVWVAVQAPT